MKTKGAGAWRSPGEWRTSMLAALLVLLAACGENVHNDELDDLVLGDGTLTPAFDAHTFDYTAEVANTVESTTVTPTTHSSDATVTVNGVSVPSGTTSAPISLAVGENTVSVVVTDDGGDSQTYTVLVTRRAPPGSNAGLEELALTAAELDQMFDSDITEYTATTGYLGASTRVVAVPEDAGAAMQLEGEPLEPGEPSDYVPLPVGDSVLPVAVTAEDGSETLTYEVEVTRASRVSLDQEGYLKASNTGPDAFGASVAVSANVAVVGAPEEASAASGVDGNQSDDSLGDAGAAYVFQRDGITWTQSAYLKASEPGAGDRFGGAVAVDGDLVVVGAEGEESLATGIDGDDGDNSSNRVGAVYVFRREGLDAWAQDAYIKASNADGGDEFGRYLDMDGSRVIVGAWSEDSSATGVDGDGGNDTLPGSGAAYLFFRDAAGTWVEEAYLKASNTGGGDEFGRAVAVSGSTAVVGAPEEDSSATGIGGEQADDFATSAGAVYVFDSGEDGDWSQTAYVKASNTDAGDDFGGSLSLDGGLLAVGAPGEDGGSAGIGGNEQDDSVEDAGAVYVFQRDEDGEWSQEAYVKASNPDVGDAFGSAVALHGNVLVVGARGENSAAVGLDGDEVDDSSPDAGAVYVFHRSSSGAWEQLVYVKASNTGSGDEFGGAVAFYGDTLLVGAELERSADTGIDGDDTDDTVTGAGAAYVLR